MPSILRGSTVDEGHIDATLSAIGSKTTYTGAGASVVQAEPAKVIAWDERKEGLLDTMEAMLQAAQRIRDELEGKVA